MGDRQLNDLWYSWLRINQSVSIEQGWAWDHQVKASVAAGAVERVRMETANRAVVLFEVDVTTDGARGVQISLFVGGQIDLSSPLGGFPLNQERPRASPWTDISENGFLAEAGTQIATLLVDEPGRTVATPNFLMAPGEVYYLEVLNLDNQSAQIDVAIIAGSVGGMLS